MVYKAGQKMKTLFIGLGHSSRVGKNSFANAFIKHCHAFYPLLTVAQTSFAYRIKLITYDLYKWSGLRHPSYYETISGLSKRNEPLPLLGGMTPIEIWVKFGTDAVRENVWEDTWVDYVLNRAESYDNTDIKLITDVRFLNEVEAIKQRGGKLFKITRPGYMPLTSIDEVLANYNEWDAVYGKTGLLSDLKYEAESSADLICQEIRWLRLLV